MNTIINEDWERISQQESVYLLEKQMELEWEWWEHEHRLPAKIVVIDEDKILKNDDPVSKVLPF
jgi:hypothetical protein